MKSFTAQTHISAAPETIWKIITEADHYPEWDPWAIRIEGTVALGQIVTAYTKLSPKRQISISLELRCLIQKLLG